MKQGVTKMGNRISAWLLTLVMIIGLAAVPAGEVKAESNEVDLNPSTTATTATANSGVVEVPFTVPTEYNTLEKMQDAGITKLQVTFKVSKHTADGNAGAQVYVQYGSAWKSGTWVNLADNQELTAVLDLSSYFSAGGSVNAFGIQFANITGNITYQIISAKLIGDGSTGSGGSESDGGATSDEVTAKVTKLSGNSDWAEFNYSVTNGTDSPISGIQIKVPASGSVNNLQSWNCSASYSGGYIIISHSAILQAGKTYNCDSDTKFGFAGGASLGTPIVEFVYGEDGGGTSSSALNYELTGKTKNLAFADTPVGKHGKLSLKTVDGYKTPVIVDKNGKPFQLRGASTHGIQWNEMRPYVNEGSFQSLRDEWGVNMVRLACYVTQGGYTAGSKDPMDSTIQTGVEAAKKLGMYVIVDWHIHEENPHTTKSQAEEFFRTYATKYKDYDNVIFEICNEPTGVSWYNNGSGGDLYSYCKDIAKIIRDCGSNALIVCGTNTWSQDVDDVAKKPLKDDGFENILYTFHFYSGSHYEDKMNKVRTALAAGTPIFVTEFGICDASGNGGFDTVNADKWIELCDANNISYACWSLCNKNESASYLKPSSTKTTGGWTESDLATTGIWLVNTYRAHQDKEEGTDTSNGEFSLSVEPESGQLDDVGEGYTNPGKFVITVTNTGGKELGNWSVKMGRGTSTPFVITKNFGANTTLAAGKDTTIEVSLGSGKTVGTYNDSVIVQSGTQKKTVTIKQTVVEAQIPAVPVKSVSLNKNNLTLTVGSSEQLTATVLPSDATSKTVTWKSSNNAVAKVDATGVVTAVAIGSADITATAGGKSASCTVTVKTPPAANLSGAQNSVVCAPLVYGYSAPGVTTVNINNTGDATATGISTGLESGANSKFEIKTNLPGSIAAGANGTLGIAPKSGLAAGTYQEALIIQYNSNKTLRIPVSVTVSKKDITVKADNKEKVYSEDNPVLTYQVISGQVVQNDSLTVALNTTATKTSDAGTYDITVTVANNANYNITTEKGTLTIKQKAVTSIEFPTAGDITVGQTLKASTLSGGDNSYGTFAWKNSSQSLARGTHEAEVVLTLSTKAKQNYSFNGVKGYNSEGTITQSIKVNVNRAGLPTIVFPTASTLQYGQRLGESKLTGGSTQYGTFEWVNSSMEMTKIGTQSYDVIFKWNTTYKDKYGILDTDDDVTQTKPVSVTVEKKDRTDVPQTAVLSVRRSNGIVVRQESGVQYSKDNLNWQDSAEFSGLVAFTGYKIYTRYKETSTQKASASSNPLSVYTLVADPYTIDVSKLDNPNYVEALYTEYNVNGTQHKTVDYNTASKELTLTDDTTKYAKGYTITGNNPNVTIKTGYGNYKITLQNATVKKVDLSSAVKADIVITGNVNVKDEIFSSTATDVTISGTGTLTTKDIDISNGTLDIQGGTINAGVPETGKPGISAEQVTITDATVNAEGGNGAPGIQGEDVTITDSTVNAKGGNGEPGISGSNSVTITDSTVTAEGGSGASAIEGGDVVLEDSNLKVESDAEKGAIASGDGEDQDIVIKGDTEVTSDTCKDNLYSEPPVDENGKPVTRISIIFLDTDETELDSKEVSAGTTIKLPSIDQEQGYQMTWKNRRTGKSYKAGESVKVTENTVFIVVATKILVTRITLDSTKETIEVGDGVALAETVEPSNAYDDSVTWSSNNTKVATVDQDGEVTGEAPGTAVITVKANDGSGKYATCTVTVVEGDPEEVEVEKIKITGDTKKVAPGKKLKLTATVYPEDATNQKVVWKVSNTKYASVNSKGVVTTKKAGKGKSVTVTAVSDEDSTIKATYKISIMKKAVTKIKLSASKKVLKKGKSVTVKAKFTPSAGISKELTWTSSNPNVATVSSKGKVKAKKKGKVKITAKAKDGSGKKATITIKVK